MILAIGLNLSVDKTCSFLTRRSGYLVLYPSASSYYLGSRLLGEVARLDRAVTLYKLAI